VILLFLAGTGDSIEISVLQSFEQVRNIIENAYIKEAFISLAMILETRLLWIGMLLVNEGITT
jgi:hypothetical protein